MSAGKKKTNPPAANYPEELPPGMTDCEAGMTQALHYLKRAMAAPAPDYEAGMTQALHYLKRAMAELHARLGRLEDDCNQLYTTTDRLTEVTANLCRALANLANAATEKN